MRFCILGSGSEGNALVVEAGRTRILVDCGFGPGETLTRLARAGLAAEDLHAIVVTHEHSDHVGGLNQVAAKWGLPVWITHGTLRALGSAPPDARLMAPDEAFAVGDIEVLPVPVPHDAREPVQFVFGDGDRRLGLLTDTGAITPHIRRAYAACHALVLECNHDLDMLAAGDYPEFLKRRIAGRFGHLDNTASAGLLASLDAGRLRHLVAAHLSRRNNTPGLARAALASALGCSPDWIAVADQDEGLDWRQL